MKDPFDVLVRTTLQKIFVLLGDRCFKNGTLIIDLNDSPHLTRFIDAVIKMSHPRPIAKTHRFFSDSSLFQKHRMCRRISSVCSKETVHEETPQMEYVFSPRLDGICDSISSAGVLLLYKFRFGNKKFVFLKLESSKAFSISHVKTSIQFYVMKEMTKGRRETNTTLDTLSAVLADDKNRVLKLCKSLKFPPTIVNKIIKDIEFYDRQIRVGHEFFLPGIVATSVL